MIPANRVRKLLRAVSDQFEQQKLESIPDVRQLDGGYYLGVDFAHDIERRPGRLAGLFL